MPLSKVRVSIVRVPAADMTSGSQLSGADYKQGKVCSDRVCGAAGTPGWWWCDKEARTEGNRGRGGEGKVAETENERQVHSFARIN